MAITSGPFRVLSFAAPPALPGPRHHMNAILRKYSTSLLTFGIYLAIVAFAAACSLGLI